MDAVAIIGMGCLFPGAETPEQYWQNLLAQKDCATPLSDQELGVDPSLYYNPVKGTPDKICYTTNGHVRGFEFNPHGYALPADELEQLDNLFKWTLYAADQAFCDSGYRKPDTDTGDKKTGLILGNIGMPNHGGKRLLNGFYNTILEPYIKDLLNDERFEFGRYWDAEKLSDVNLSTCSYNAILAARALDLNGPCYALDAACSSALYAIKSACYYLNSGKADMMLAGAVCHADHVYIDHGFNVLQAFPDKGESAPFDKNSEGLKAGEGAGVIALKRLADAERDGDRIDAVIDAIGLSNDAGAKHILVPDQQGQILALRRAYEGVDKAVDYVECHATGTPVGDQVELNSIEQFFYAGPEVPLLGANKGNIGHMLTASGMAGILKVLLAMRHNTIPGTVKMQDMVETKKGRIGAQHVVRENIPWPQAGGVKRAGINAFGFGGVNGHLVISEHAGQSSTAGQLPQASRQERSAKASAIAITGMSVGMASTQNLKEFDSAIRNGEQFFQPLPQTRWSGIETRNDVLERYSVEQIPSGAYIEKLEFDCKRFKLPPKNGGYPFTVPYGVNAACRPGFLRCRL